MLGVRFDAGYFERTLMTSSSVGQLGKLRYRR